MLPTKIWVETTMIAVDDHDDGDVAGGRAPGGVDGGGGREQDEGHQRAQERPALHAERAEGP